MYFDKVCYRFAVHSELFKRYGASLEFKFPDDRMSRQYEAYVVTLRRVGPALKHIQDAGIQAEVTYCMKALKHLKVDGYYDIPCHRRCITG